MHLNTKIIAAIGLLAGVVLLASMTSIQQQQQEEHKFKNLKVLPKHITERQLDAIMGQWRRSLGVNCNFCHEQDKSLDTKPEKLMARKMFLMAAKINSKYFDAKKDSLGMMMESSVSCNTCHRGAAHPEVALPAQAPRGQGTFGGQGGQRPGGQGAPAGTSTGGQGGGTTTPPPPKL
jgi:hypothetical protein